VRHLMFVLLLLIAPMTILLAQSTEKLLEWSHLCTKAKDKCWLEKRVEYSSDSGLELGGIAVAYDNVLSKPLFITIWAPKDVPRDSEVLIRFVDSVKKDGEWTLVPVGHDFIAIPITECGEDDCTAKVYSDIVTSDSSEVNIFEELKKRSILWVMFKRSKEPERYMIPLSGINDVLAEIKLTQD
jgi:hypothetical protein